MILIKHRIAKSLMNSLYAEPNRYFKNKISDIIIRNNKANRIGQLYGEIIYEGRIYKNYNETGTYYFVRTLPVHPTLEEEFKTYVDKVDELELEQIVINRFMTILLNFTESDETLKRLIGEGLFQTLKGYLFDIKGCLKSDGEIKDFENEHKEYLTKMRERFIDNMLMRNIYESKN